MSRVCAYRRVSKQGSTTENQVQELAAAGFAVDPRRVVEETISGASAIAQRPGFAKLLERLEEGDVLLVTKLDRLGGNVIDIVSTVDQLKAMAVRVHCLQLGGADLAGSVLYTPVQIAAATPAFYLALGRPTMPEPAVPVATVPSYRYVRPFALSQFDIVVLRAR